ncbi:MAG: hypothetical protein AB8B74_04965 [Crocinitomicaceae bacterium]
MAYKINVFSFLILFSVNVHSQSPWVNKKGSLYGQVSFTNLSYSSVINDELNEIVPTDFKSRDLTTSLFADYSLTDKMAVLANLPFKAVQHNNQSLSSLGDPTLKLKYRFLKNIPLAVNVGYMAPFSKREGVLRTGYSQHAAELGLSIGKGKERSFMYGGLGYRFRANIPSQALVEFEYGHQFLLTKKQKPFYLIFRIDGALLTSQTEDEEAGLANFYHNGGEFLSPALKLSFNAFGNFWFNAAAHSAVIVRNFGASSTLNFGLAYKIEK